MTSRIKEIRSQNFRSPDEALDAAVECNDLKWLAPILMSAQLCGGGRDLKDAILDVLGEAPKGQMVKRC